MSDEGPFTDDMIRHMVKVHATQQGIIDFVEAAAKVLAEAARASYKATGDSPETAARRWSDIILNRALEHLKEQRDAALDQKRVQFSREYDKLRW